MIILFHLSDSGEKGTMSPSAPPFISTPQPITRSSIGDYLTLEISCHLGPLRQSSVLSADRDYRLAFRRSAQLAGAESRISLNDAKAPEPQDPWSVQVDELFDPGLANSI